MNIAGTVKKDIDPAYLRDAAVTSVSLVTSSLRVDDARMIFQLG